MIPPELLTALRDHLTAELACHRSLLALGEQQQVELIANRIHPFAELVAKAEPMTTEQQRLRKVRERLLAGLTAVLGRPGKIPTLAEIIAQAPEPHKGELSSRHLLLKDALLRLRSVCDRNQSLLRQGLGFVRDLVGTLTGEPTRGDYDRRGQGGNRPGNGRLVDLAG